MRKIAEFCPGTDVETGCQTIPHCRVIHSLGCHLGTPFCAVDIAPTRCPYLTKKIAVLVCRNSGKRDRENAGLGRCSPGAGGGRGATYTTSGAAPRMAMSTSAIPSPLTRARVSTAQHSLRKSGGQNLSRRNCPMKSYGPGGPRGPPPQIHHQPTRGASRDDRLRAPRFSFSNHQPR